jgi:hypothetical protein
MKARALIFVFWFLGFSGISQNQTIILGFTGVDSVTQLNVPLDSVFIENLTAGGDTTIYGAAPSVTLFVPLGLPERTSGSTEPFQILPSFQNPADGSTTVRVQIFSSGSYTLKTMDMQGRTAFEYRDGFAPGLHSFRLESSGARIILFSVSTGLTTKTVKLLQPGTAAGENRISYTGMCGSPVKAGDALAGFTYRLGDLLSFRSMKWGYYDKVITDSPPESTSYTFELNMIPTAPSVITLGVPQTGATMATGEGEVVSDGGMPVTARGICWSTSENPTLADPHTLDGAGTGTFTGSITGLDMLTMYHARAYAVNGVDTAYGEDIPFATVSVPDGFYVAGAAAAYRDLDAHAIMKVTRNEVTQTDDPQLLELYIPLMAGAEGFSIRKVVGTEITTYGPGADFEVILQGSTDEPKVPFQRGSYAENTIPFTVPEEGMYHVVIYQGTTKAVVVPVHWGMIGSATALGWSGSTAMPESPFNPMTMSWTIDSLALHLGEWKFRYSDGWKVELDTTVILGGGMKGVKVNANFGQSVSQLVPGGANIQISDPGSYTCTMQYTLGSGYTASLVKTGSLPPTVWMGVMCDAVGTGISPENPTATPDTSAWNWGNQMLGDNGGIPTWAGLVYTWTWTNIILEAYQGFKLRTLNGVPPPSGGAYFDAGYSDLNVGASAPEIIDSGGNLMATVKDFYTITLKIDAGNNDNRELIIVRN